MTELRRYESPEAPDRSEFEAMVAARDLTGLQRAIIGLALHDEDAAFVEDACLMLFHTFADAEFVRGNAVLGLGHLARRFGALSEASRAAIEEGLLDPSRWVSGHADSAAGDARFFLRWTVAGIAPAEPEPEPPHNWVEVERECPDCRQIALIRCKTHVASSGEFSARAYQMGQRMDWWPADDDRYDTWRAADQGGGEPGEVVETCYSDCGACGAFLYAVVAFRELVPRRVLDLGPEEHWPRRYPC